MHQCSHGIIDQPVVGTDVDNDHLWLADSQVNTVWQTTHASDLCLAHLGFCIFKLARILVSNMLVFYSVHKNTFHLAKHLFITHVNISYGMKKLNALGAQKLRFFYRHKARLHDLVVVVAEALPVADLREQCHECSVTLTNHLAQMVELELTPRHVCAENAPSQFPTALIYTSHPHKW